MHLQSAFPKTASRKKFFCRASAAGGNRPQGRAASRVWASRLRNRVGLICYADHLGSPRAITRPSDNQVVWKNENTEPFGNNPRNENPSGLGNFEYNLGFPGQYCDKETNICQNWFRDYDPATGRYIQSDPIGLKGGINTFAYVYDNPISNIDPKGLDIWQCTRQVKLYLGGVGNHTYIWDDRNGQCCGRDDGKDPLKNCKERGRDGGDSCVRIGGSSGQEDKIMSCCQKTANQGSWRPFKNDCHDSIDRCLKEVGIPSPGAPGGRLRGCDSCWLTDKAPPIEYTAP